MVNRFISAILLLGVISLSLQEDINLPDLDPQDAQQIIEQQDNSLKYAPKVESNVPAVRYLGNEPHNVVEDIYLANQYHGQDGLGGYLYGYSVPDISKTEKKKAGGDLRGAYNYIANGREIKVEYWDDGTGFHQIDNVPKNLPEDLPAVKAEKERFLKRWQEEAERNSRPVEDPYNSEGQYKEGPLSPQGQLQRQQQFAAQFGKSTAYKQPQGAASQQSAIYQSNLERTQPYSSNYQSYQGKDQQNQGAYKSEKLTALPKGPQAATGYGQTSGGYGAQPSGGYGSTGGYGAQPSGGYGAQPSGGYGSTSGGQSGYGAQRPVVSSGYGGQGNSGYGGSTGGYGTQTSAPAYGSPSTSGYGGQSGYGSSGGYGSQPSGGQTGYGGSGGYGSQPSGSGSAYGGQGASGYGAKPSGSGSAYGGQGASGYGAKPSGSGSGYGGQTTTGYGGSGGYGARPTGAYGLVSGGYVGQSSQNINKYAALQSAPYGQGSETHSKYISSQGEEDDGSYKPEKDEEQGPPRGFFYKFDYPVGIIVSKQGPAQGGYQDQQKKLGSY